MSESADDLTQRYAAARERLSATRARLDEFGGPAGPIDEMPGDGNRSFDPAYAAALAEYQSANEDFAALEDQLRPRWAAEAAEPVESAPATDARSAEGE